MCYYYYYIYDEVAPREAEWAALGGVEELVLTSNDLE